MTNKQENWINEQISALKTIAKTFFAGGTVPSDEELEAIDNIQHLILARTNNNANVRKAFINMNEELANIEKGIRNDKKV